MIDRKSATHVSPKVQDLFFMMAVSNSCMDPLVYGSYTLDPRTFSNSIRKIFCITSRTTDIPGICGPVIKSKSTENNQDNIKLNSTRQFDHFKDLSSKQPCVNSEPVVFTTVDQPIKPAISCDL
ncbi:uncharacterized protein LOC119192361, partial [Manduca sexta]|uniref:uncharacterized protein LOC119192361 n=1 Tax=Manduca sexta TaxID=7130 RepID=UPI00188E9166